MEARPTILICDDEPKIISALAREARHHNLSFISDSSSALVHELARLHKPEVIVLDINQRIDGRDLLAALKKDPATRECAVVILSGVTDQFTRHTCFSLGAADYFVKPIDSL